MGWLDFFRPVPNLHRSRGLKTPDISIVAVLCSYCFGSRVQAIINNPTTEGIDVRLKRDTQAPRFDRSRDSSRRLTSMPA